MYFYKTATTWVLGQRDKSFMPTGYYFMTQVSDTKVDIRPIDDKNRLPKFLGVDVTTIAKNTGGTKYASMSEFTSAVGDFFVSTIVKGDKGDTGAAGAAGAAGPAGAAGAAGSNGLFSAELAYCADYPALRTAMIAAGLMASNE